MKNIRADSLGINLKAVALCLAMAVLISSAGIAVTALLIYTEKLPMEGMSLGLVISLLGGCMLPAFVVAAKLNNRWANGALYAGLLLVIIAVLDAILFHGEMKGLLPTAAVIFGATAASFLLSGLNQKKGKRRYRKIRNG